MESVQGSPKASKFALEEDVISSLPDDVITNILHRLPLQDAVRTSILSRNWRYNWTMINQLVFDEDFYEYLKVTKNRKYYGRIISRLLLHLKGAIKKFDLYIEKGCHSIRDVEDINNWVLDLSKKGILEFTLINMDETPIKLSTHLFSCLELKHMELYKCHFCPLSTFCGFPNILSLDLSEVVFGSCTCGQILSQCPLLEILKLGDNSTSEIKRVEIAKLKNLKVLILPLCELDNMTMTSSDVIQLMGSFPELQELNLDFWNCELLAYAEKGVRAALPCLKTLRLYEIDFSNVIMVSCAIDFICGFPNLETLLIKAPYEDDVPASAGSSSAVDFGRMGQLQLQLRTVEFVFVGCIKNEVCLMKSLLASSPLLKKLVINPKSSKVFGGEDGHRKFSRELKRCLASPVAEIVFESGNNTMTFHDYPAV